MAKGTRAEVQSRALNMPAALTNAATVIQMPSHGPPMRAAILEIAFFHCCPIGVDARAHGQWQQVSCRDQDDRKHHRARIDAIGRVDRAGAAAGVVPARGVP